MPIEWGEGNDPVPAPVPPPPAKPPNFPLQVGGVTRRARRPPSHLFQPPGPTTTPPPPDPITPPGFVEEELMPPDPTVGANFQAALPELPQNWNAILQALGFFSGPAGGGGATDLPMRLRKDPLARLR